MSRYMVVLLLVVVGLVLQSGDASAHVLLKDQIKGNGAILHVNPDDDPVAGEPASLFFDIRDPAIAGSVVAARLTISDSQGKSAIVSSHLQDTGVSASYVFPQRGLYEIKLEVRHDGTITHRFVQSQRVSRGLVGHGTSSATPAWAEVGMIFSVITALLLAIIAFNRRKTISNYSKF